jgi:poly(hydroxyalkanoate) granule-associated protein
MSTTKEKNSAVEGLRKIWLAGLGALAEAERKGDAVFQTLVASGEKYHDSWREPVERAGESVRESVASARDRASAAFQDLESALDRQVAAAMKRVGVASRADVAALKAEITRLSKAVEKTPKKKTTGKARKARKSKTISKKKSKR